MESRKKIPPSLESCKSMVERSRYSVLVKDAGVGGGILKNKLGIKNQKELDDAETLLLADAYRYFFARLEKERLPFTAGSACASIGSATSGLCAVGSPASASPRSSAPRTLGTLALDPLDPPPQLHRTTP